ncbi:MAG: xanthine dehydrogenase family protein molybdopterin-binding subunit, partial [Halobacteriales archaeon]|nr:xanthine dehydrogenase family protein molybdopterin-binding subunit [Halobacteriales archaeon]
MTADGIDSGTAPNPQETSTPGPTIGESVERVEDRRFLTGQGTYMDNLEVPGAAHVAFLRSQYGHALVHDIDTSAADAMDGVLGVITRGEIEAADLPTPGRLPRIPGPGVDPPEQLNRPVIAGEKVRHQGEVIAMVVAEDRYRARDAVAAIDVEYERLDAVVDPAEAIAGGAPTVHDGTPDNVAFEWEFGDGEAMDRIIEEAAHTVSIEIGNQRIVQNPIEPRGAIGEFDPSSGELTLRSTTQVPHFLKRYIAETLQYPERKIRVAAPDMGGGFGSRCVPYPEEMLIAWGTMYLERPLRWQGTRSNNYLNDIQGRGTATEGTLAIDEEGTITGLRIDLLDDMGAYLSAFAPGIAITCTNVMTGQYDIPAANYRVTGAMTNATPSDAYRGVIETELIHTLERLMDLGAREVGLDPAEFRRRNFVPTDAFPYETATGASYDSGDYGPALDRALELADYDDLRERQKTLREEGRYLGIGMSAWIEKCGFGCGGPVTSWEYSNIQVHPSGEVTVYAGTSNHGQGHETTYAQVTAEKLGVPMEDITIVEDDTGTVRDGVGTFASRCALTAGGSIGESAAKLVAKGKRVAAHEFETDPADIEFEAGEFSVAGAPDRSISIQDVAAKVHLGYDIPADMEPGFEATSYYDPEDYQYPFGVQLVVVEVDPEAGEFTFEQFISIDDCGVQINPKIVEGQVHGGVAQGLGQALYEGAQFDGNGTLLTGSHMDYALPKADQVPDMETDYTVTP